MNTLEKIVWATVLRGYADTYHLNENALNYLVTMYVSGINIPFVYLTSS